MDRIEEAPRSTPVLAEYEVLVLGGGPSGVAAATAAARAGAKTGLVERYGFLGGMGTAAMVTNFCGLHASVDGAIARVVRGIASDITDRMDRLDGLRPLHHLKNPTGGPGSATQAYDGSVYKVVLDDVVLGAGVHVHFHSFAVGTVVQDRRIDAVIIESKSGRGAIRSKIFIDCSGDADLAYWSGVPCEKGDGDGFMAFPTTMFRVGNVRDETALSEGKPNVAALIERHAAEYALPRTASAISSLPHAGEWLCNLTQISRDGAVIDGTLQEDLSFAESEGRRQVLRYLRFLKDKVPGFENAYMLETAPQIGIRETRRIVGQVVLSGDDVLACRDFDDSIGLNGWPLEMHLKGSAKWVFLEGRGYHQIPFGSTIPQGIDNLLVAGRCASTTQSGQASLRVSGPCYAMGQAAGTAAAMATDQGLDPRDVAIEKVQARLRQDGACLSAADL